jgi:hypothetical protein
MDNFEYIPVHLDHKNAKIDRKTGSVRVSMPMKFSGAISQAEFGINGIDIISPYGCINNTFLWIDENGKQRAVEVKGLKTLFEKLLISIQSPYKSFIV